MYGDRFDKFLAAVPFYLRKSSTFSAAWKNLCGFAAALRRYEKPAA
jgi:hypothetical protein